MIQSEKVKELVNSKIEGTDLFLVDVIAGKSNEIRVLVDSMQGIHISECVELSRWLEGELDLLGENFSLEVSSPGLSEPLLIDKQYIKNIGRTVELLFTDGRKKKGKLVSVEGTGLTLEVSEKMLGEGSQKKKKHVLVNRTFEFKDIKTTKVVIEF